MATVPESLETARLTLRRPEPKDTEPWIAMCADPELTRHVTPGGVPLSREDAWRALATLIGHWEIRGYGMWILEERRTGAFLGRAGLWRPEGWPGLEVGWMLVRGAWGNGYALEAARAAVEVARERKLDRRLVSVIHPENARSIRVAERLGERPAGDVEVRGVLCRLYELELDG